MTIKTVKNVLLSVVSLAVLFLYGYTLGSQKQKDIYEKREKELNHQIALMKEDYRKKVEEHAKNQRQLLQDIEDTKREHEDFIADLRDEFSDRMLQSEKRGNIYRARAESAGAECRQLAEHAARLDQSLTEGRELVKEFRADLEQCRVSAHIFTDIIMNDRNHFDGNN